MKLINHNLIKFIFFVVIVSLTYSCGLTNHDSTLARFNIEVDTEDLNFGEYTKGNISFYDSSGLIVFKDNSIKIKYRGNASAHYDKKCFSIKFSDKKGLGFSHKSKNWKLNAEYIDKTFMRNKLSYDLFRMFSPNNYAPQIRYVEVYLNHDYRGIYTLTERVDSDRLGLIKNDSNTVLFKEPPISNLPEIHSQKYEGMVRYSKVANFYKDFSESAFDELLKRAYYNQRIPDIYEKDMNYLIHEITEFVCNSDISVFSDSLQFNKYFKIDNIIDWHLLLLLTNNGDGIVKNFYLYRKGKNEPFLFCPWDFDQSYGRDGDGELNQESFIDISRMKLITRLLETNTFNYRDRIFKKFVELKNSNVLTIENIESMIDSNSMILGSVIQESELRWPPDSIDLFISSNFYNEVDMMKQWINRQLPAIELYLTNLTNHSDDLNILTGKISTSTD